MKITFISIDCNKLKRSFSAWKRKPARSTAINFKGYKPICRAYSKWFGYTAGLITALSWGTAAGIEASFFSLALSKNLQPVVATTTAISGLIMGGAIFGIVQYDIEKTIPNKLASRNIEKQRGNHILHTCQGVAWGLVTILPIAAPYATKVSYRHMHYLQIKKKDNESKRPLTRIKTKRDIATAVKLIY